MKRTPNAFVLIAIIASASYLGAQQGALSPAKSRSAYEKAVSALSGKRAYISDDHKERMYAYLPFLSHTDLTFQEREQLWNLYLLRLMVDKVMVDSKGKESSIDLTDLPELHEIRWHTLRYFIKDKSVQQLVGIVALSTFCLSLFFCKEKPVRKMLKESAIGTAIVSGAFALALTFAAFMFKEGGDRIERIYRSLNELREDERCRAVMPPSVVQRLNQLHLDLAAVTPSDSEADLSHMRPRHDVMLRFYLQTRALVPSSII